MEERILVGVYDGLRKFCKSHYPYMEGATYLGTYYTEPDYTMYYLSPEYPGVKLDGSESILLEIYEVTKDILHNIDYFEGVCSTQKFMNIYNRVNIDTPFGPTWIYEYNRVVVNRPKIYSGDWLRYKIEIGKSVKKHNVIKIDG